MTVVTGPAVEWVRVLALRRALKLEVLGMRRRGRSVYSIVKEEFGFRGGKQKVLDQLSLYIEKEMTDSDA